LHQAPQGKDLSDGYRMDPESGSGGRSWPEAESQSFAQTNFLAPQDFYPKRVKGKIKEDGEEETDGIENVHGSLTILNLSQGRKVGARS